MPKYQLQYRIDDRLVEGSEMQEHPDLDAAHASALEWANELLSEAVESGESAHAPRSIDIADSDGEIVLYVVFWGNLLAPARPSGATVH